MLDGRSRRNSGISRRLALGGLALGGISGGTAPGEVPQPVCGHSPCYPTSLSTQGYGYFKTLEELNPVVGGKRTWPALEKNEMRISFLGSVIPQYGRAQMMMSIFVEVGWVEDEYYKNAPTPQTRYKAQDQFVFDCGHGVIANYNAMNIGFSRMDKIFLSHLHPDHMNDLTSIYGFGPSSDRKSPLFVWGPGPSGHKNPNPPYQIYDDGTKAFCKNFREANRWETESFSFQGTRYKSYKPPTKESWRLPHDPVPVGDDPIDDGYAVIPIELDWTKYGAAEGDNVAYENRQTGVKITHFPVIHTRKGSMGFKLEWNGLSMIYTSDTRPEWNSIKQAINMGKGVDVFIHEMVPPPEVWAMKMVGLSQPGDPKDPTWAAAVQAAKEVQDSSHTTQGAFGYLLSQIEPRPRLTVATHFPTNDDTVGCAFESVKRYCPWIKMDKNVGNFVWSYDFMVLRVFPDRIEQRRGVVSDYTYAPYPLYTRYDMLPPKYHEADGSGDPRAQLDTTAEIPPGPFTYCEDGY